MSKIIRIEINFPVPVELPPGFDRALDGLTFLITEKYKLDNPDRTMWPAGQGGKIMWNEPSEPDVDIRVYSIDVAEREKTDKEKQREARRQTAV